MDPKIAANQALWDSRVADHVASTFYDVPSFLAGKCSLMAPELQALGDVSGQSLLHLQCHFGMDTLSWARRGAQVTGIDISEKAIAQARALAEQTGLDARFVASSVYDLPHNLAGQFDIVFTSYGTITWLPDIQQWADVVRHFLKPGGRFCIAEFHPTWYALDWDNYSHAYPYFNQGEAFEEVVTKSYTGAEAPTALKEYFWCHGLGEVMQALIDRGLRVEQFRELSYSPYNCFPNLEEVRPGEWIPKGLGEGKVPMMYVLKGTM